MASVERVGRTKNCYAGVACGDHARDFRALACPYINRTSESPDKKIKVISIMTERLIPSLPNKTITAFDIFGNAQKRQLENFKFRASAYGVLVENNKVLLKRHPSVDKFELPGGGIGMDEAIPDGLIREFEEETGLIVKVGELLLVEDSFFTHNQEDVHGILIFYKVNKLSGIPTPNDDDSIEVRYLDIDSLNHDNLQRFCWNTIELFRLTSTK